MKWAVLVVLLVNCVCSAQTRSAAQKTDPALWKELTEIDSRAATIQDLKADFEQDKFTALLKKPLKSAGKIYIKGSAMLWDTTVPEPGQMRIDEKEARIFYPRQNIVEVYPIDAKLSSLAASPLPRLSVLKEHFLFEKLALPQGEDADKVLNLKMMPMESELQKHVDHVIALLDREHGFILHAQMTDADGDRTILSFSNIQVNVGLSDDALQIRAPKDAKIVHPLEGMTPESK